MGLTKFISIFFLDFKKKMNQNKNIFSVLQDKFMGKTGEKLSLVEINYLFNRPLSPEFILILKEAIERKLMEPDDAFIQLLARSKTKDYLIPMALCIRNKDFNPNFYVNIQNLGIIHILGYVHYVLPDHIEIRDSIIYMLLLKSSNYSLPIFDKTGGSIKNYVEENEFKTISVKEWIQNQGYTSPILKIKVLNNDKILEPLDNKTKNNLAMILDNPSLGDNDYKSADMTNAIRSFSKLTMNSIPFSNTMILMDNKYLVESVIYLNYNSFQFIIEKGVFPSYILINKIILAMKFYSTKKDFVSMKTLENMLVLAISYGSELDMEQYNLLGFTGKIVLENINKEYNQPYWRKICKSSFGGKEDNFDKNIPDNLKRTALSLNIDPYLGKKGICESISQLSKADKELIKETMQKRQKYRMTAALGNINDFMDETVPTLRCRNGNLLQNDVNSYIDIAISSYKDDQGAIWCFTDDNYSNILENGTNQYNGTKIPESFKNDIQNKIKILKDLGMEPKTGYAAADFPRLFSQSIDKITENDIISDKNSILEISKFKNLAIKNNVPVDIFENFDKNRMLISLNNLGLSKEYIEADQLSNSHLLVTIARIINFKNQMGENIMPFFQSLSINTTDF